MGVACCGSYVALTDMDDRAMPRPGRLHRPPRWLLRVAQVTGRSPQVWSTRRGNTAWANGRRNACFQEGSGETHPIVRHGSVPEDGLVGSVPVGTLRFQGSGDGMVPDESAFPGLCES